MRRLIVFLMLLFIAINAYSQEQPEPNANGFIYAYRIEICWGTLMSTSVWQSMTYNSSVQIGAVGTHNYNGKLGIQTWEADVTSDPLIPKKLTISFDIGKNMIPNDAYNYHFYRLRIVSWLVDATGKVVSDEVISPFGWWVVIYTPKSTGQPVKK